MLARIPKAQLGGATQFLLVGRTGGLASGRVKMGQRMSTSNSLQQLLISLDLADFWAALVVVDVGLETTERLTSIA